VHAVVATDASRADETRKAIVRACLAAAAAKPGTALRVLVCGVPNVGKSTLINTLMGRDVARASDRPAVTTAQQTVTLKSGMVLTDSPGLMWPKIDDEVGAMRLALAGSIPDTAIDYYSVALFGAAYFLDHCAAALVTRYKLPAVPPTPTALLEEIGRRRAGLRPGGAVDTHKASEVLVHEYRQGAIGRMTLESVPAAAAAAPVA
jgi:ribosome biogenesis GTPase A